MRNCNKFTEQFRAERARFDQRVVTYDELRVENGMLKRDLQNIDVNLHKVELDGQLREERQQELDRRSTALAKRDLTENVKLIVSSIGPSNFTGCKNRLIEVIARVRELGYEVTTGEEEQLLADLRGEFERAVRGVPATGAGPDQGPNP